MTDELETAIDPVEPVAPVDDLPPLELTETALEALLFVAERPLSRREIASLAGVDRATVDQRLGDLEVALAARGIRLLIDGDRVELATAPEGGALIARYVGVDAIRLSPASLETLAIVAYRQPVTRAAIERIRGVDSDYTVRSLLHRRLIVELGRSDAPGRPFLYGTGFDFLERFGLASLEELPPLDVDVAARLAEEGGEALTEPLFPDERRRRGLMPAERLQKVLAAAGVASRRGAESMIAAGRVTVDGRVATLGTQADPERSVIAVDGRVIGSAAARAYLLQHKPAGVTSTTRDRHASSTVLDLVPTALVPDGARLYPVGRLDQDCEGMLLLTNDGEWAERVLHPRHGVEREYALGLREPLRAEQVSALHAGIQLEEGLATLGGPRPMSAADVGRLTGLLRPPPPDARVVSGHPDAGLEAAAAADVRRGRGARRSTGAGADRSRPDRGPPQRRHAAPEGARGPGPGERWRSLAAEAIPGVGAVPGHPARRLSFGPCTAWSWPSTAPARPARAASGRPPLARSAIASATPGCCTGP